jgi:hypothetical protein
MAVNDYSTSFQPHSQLRNCATGDHMWDIFEMPKCGIVCSIDSARLSHLNSARIPPADKTLLIVSSKNSNTTKLIGSTRADLIHHRHVGPTWDHYSHKIVISCDRRTTSDVRLPTVALTGDGRWKIKVGLSERWPCPNSRTVRNSHNFCSWPQNVNYCSINLIGLCISKSRASVRLIPGRFHTPLGSEELRSCYYLTQTVNISLPGWNSILDTVT